MSAAAVAGSTDSGAPAAAPSKTSESSRCQNGEPQRSTSTTSSCQTTHQRGADSCVALIRDVSNTSAGTDKENPTRSRRRRTPPRTKVVASLEDDSATGASDCGNVRIHAFIPGWRVGTIIGRQGATINQLRQETHVQIIISDPDMSTPDRQMTVVGPHAHVAEALCRICALLAPETPSRTGTAAGEEGGVPTNDASKDTSFIFAFAVPSPHCGCLLGRGGAQIREFRQSFGVGFTVASEPLTRSDERLVTISGPVSKVADCLTEVCRLLSTCAPLQRRVDGEESLHGRYGNPVSRPNHYSTRERDDSRGGQGPLPFSGGRFDGLQQWAGERVTEGRGGGRYLSRGDPQFAAAGRYPHGYIDGSHRHHHYSSNGVRQQGSCSRGGGNEHFDPLRDESQHGRREAWHGSSKSSSGAVHNDTSATALSQDHYMAGELPPLTPHRRSEEALGQTGVVESSVLLATGETEVHLRVPNDIVGCIIGKGGATIAQIRDVSGASITITESVTMRPQSDTQVGLNGRALDQSKGARNVVTRDRIIAIRGSTNTVRTARYLMGQSILETNQRNHGGPPSPLQGPFGGGGGGPYFWGGHEQGSHQASGSNRRTQLYRGRGGPSEYGHTGSHPTHGPADPAVGGTGQYNYSYQSGRGDRSPVRGARAQEWNRSINEELGRERDRQRGALQD